MRTLMKSLGVLTLLTGLTALASPVTAATYPSRSVTAMNAFMPGGLLELAFRPIADELSKSLAVNIVISPAAGAGGVVGATKALSQKPDGYTYLLYNDSILVSLSTLRDVRFNVESFIPVCSMGSSSSSFVIKQGDARFNNLDEFVKYAKEHPGTLSIGMTGRKSGGEISMTQFMHAAGISMKLVPFDGAAAVTSALIGGHIDGAVTEVFNEQMLPLALVGDRNVDYPDLPTFQDLGYDVYWVSNNGLFALKGTDPERIKTMEDAMVKALQSPTVLTAIKNLRLGATFHHGSEWQDQIHQMRQRLQKLVDLGLITPEK